MKARETGCSQTTAAAKPEYQSVADDALNTTSINAKVNVRTTGGLDGIR
jgi:hypothetical protein